MNQTSPLLNRESQGLYPPDSIIKPLFADEALKRNVLTKTETIHCTGIYFFNQDLVLNESHKAAHGDVNMKEALTASCNVYFAELANRLQAEGVKQVFERVLFNEEFKSIGSISAIVPEFSTLRQPELIDQGSLLVTPPQMAVLAATFANQGIMMEPHLLKEMKTPNGDIIEKYKEKVLAKATSEARANFLRSCMENVMENRTGRRAWTKELKIAGKTGTAENERKIPHAWFIGFAPADHPLFDIAVIVKNGGSGGQIAAPIAKDILTYAFHEEVGQ